MVNLMIKVHHKVHHENGGLQAKMDVFCNLSSHLGGERGERGEPFSPLAVRKKFFFLSVRE